MVKWLDGLESLVRTRIENYYLFRKTQKPIRVNLCNSWQVLKMEKIDLEYFGEKFNQLQTQDPGTYINNIRKEGFSTFNKKGLPTYKNEEWKYTGISNLFKKEYHLSEDELNLRISKTDIDEMRLPGYENANELVFVNGRYVAELSTIRSAESQLVVIPLEEAANGIYKDVVSEHLGKSNLFINDGIHALNTSFIYGGAFISVNKKQVKGCS